MPLRDDWKSVSVLIRQIDQALVALSCVVDVLLVDDDSQEAWDRADFQWKYAAIQSIRTLRLRVNLGHQRAIALGLAHIFAGIRCDAIMVMDSDGEDTSAGMAELLREFRQDRGTRLIFAARSRRSESFLFRCFYAAYILLFRLLTGQKLNFGNFSIMPRSYLDTLVVRPELWNHYAASVLRSQRNFHTIPIPRGKRIAGRSRMKFVGLVAHGLSAISVFADFAGARILIGFVVSTLLTAAGGTVWLLTHPISRWAVFAGGVLGLLLLQAVAIAGLSVFLIFSNRNNLGFVPVRDYTLFVADQEDMYIREPQRPVETHESR